VRQHDRLDVVEPVQDRREVRQDQVDAGLFDVREQYPSVDDEQLAVEFEDRHVPADGTESAQRDDAQGAFGQRRWWLQLYVSLTHQELPSVGSRAVVGWSDGLQ
jgi:hypothetical protein